MLEINQFECAFWSLTSTCAIPNRLITFRTCSKLLVRTTNEHPWAQPLDLSRGLCVSESMITQTCPLPLFCIASRWRGSTFRASRPRCHRIVWGRWPQHRRPRLDETLRNRRGHRVGANTRSRKEATILEHWTKQLRRIVSISPYKLTPIAPPAVI